MQEYTPTAIFDWYAATIDTYPDFLSEMLAARLGATLRRARGLHGYPAGYDFLRGTDVVAKMIYGGDASPHVWASGNDARDLAPILRDEYPGEHYVTRVDVALDFVDGDRWDDLYREFVMVADWLPSGAERARPLKLATVGDWIRPGAPAGRTLYLGSLKSPVFARLYEKGKQMRALYPDQLDKYAPGWVRAELQVRPSGDARRDLARMDPVSIWGAAKWSAEIFRRIVGHSIDSVAIQQSRQPDDERAYRALIRQYGGLLARRAGQLDGRSIDQWAELGRRIGRDLS